MSNRALTSDKRSAPVRPAYLIGKRLTGSWMDEPASKRRKSAHSLADVSASQARSRPTSSTTCAICYESRADALVSKCGHIFACESCAQKVDKCGIRREGKTFVIKVYVCGV